jgi:hypothetical protein
LARGSALEINFQILYGVARTAIGLAAFLGGDEQTSIWGSPITQMEELNPNWRNTSSGDMFNCGIYALAGGTIGAYSTLGFENLFLGGESIELFFGSSQAPHLGTEFGWAGSHGYNLLQIGHDSRSLFHIGWGSTSWGHSLHHLHFFGVEGTIWYYNTIRDTTKVIIP